MVADHNHTARRPLPSREHLDWMNAAACSGRDLDLFFPGRGETGHRAVAEACAVCHGCPVEAQCLLGALERGERYGVWGGLSERNRRRLRHEWLRQMRRLRGRAS